jgi:hypothetical protein
MGWLITLGSLVLKVWGWLSDRAKIKEGASEQATKDQNTVVKVAETRDAQDDRANSESDDDLRRRLLRDSPDAK